MEDYFRIIYALCIIFIRFPLYYLAPVQNNFMYNDTNLCNNSIKNFLYESEYTKECKLFKYHEELDKLNVTLENVKEFLCLGVYDTAYKLCQYKEIEQWNKISSDQKSFDLIIENLMKIYQTNGSTTTSKNFCNDLVGYTPKYDKLKPALSKLTVKFEKPELCFSICFDLESKLRSPLCAILVWINKVDQEIIEKLKNDSNKVTINNVDHKNENLKNKQENHTDQPNVQHGSDNLKQLENKMKDNKIHNIERPALSIISPNNVKEENIITDNNDNINNIPNKQLPPSKENPIKVNDESNSVKSDPTIKTTPQTTSNPTINNNESHDKLTSSLKETDKKQVDENNNSQEPPPNLEEDDTTSKKKEKVDEEKNLMTDKYVNQPVTETKSTEAFDDAKITTTESNVAADNILIGSDQLKNVPTEDIDHSGDVDNPSESMSEPSKQRAHFENDEESHFLFYFAVISIGFIGGYTGYHNKKKLLAIVLKGRRSKNNRGRRRSSSPKYRKLDCTLEEAVTSQCNANVTHVIY